MSLLLLQSSANLMKKLLRRKKRWGTVILEPSFVSFSGCKNRKTSTIPAKTYQAKTVQLFCVLSKQVAGTGCPRAKAIMAISLKTMAAAGLAQTGNEELIVYRGFV